jgi:hypothetical protein
MVSGLDQVDQPELDRSLRLKLALDGIKAEGGFDAFAIRCWPETFTEYGGAVCGPVAMMGEARTPCACEADVYGAATQLLLQAASGEAGVSGRSGRYRRALTIPPWSGIAARRPCRWLIRMLSKRRPFTPIARCRCCSSFR